MKEEKKATRESYGEALLELGRENKNIVALLAYNAKIVVKKFIFSKGLY